MQNVVPARGPAGRIAERSPTGQSPTAASTPPRSGALIDAAFAVMRATGRHRSRRSATSCRPPGCRTRRSTATSRQGRAAARGARRRTAPARRLPRARGSRRPPSPRQQVRALDRGRAGAGARRRRGRSDPPVRDQRRAARRPLPRRLAATRAELLDTARRRPCARSAAPTRDADARLRARARTHERRDRAPPSTPTDARSSASSRSVSPDRRSEPVERELLDHRHRRAGRAARARRCSPAPRRSRAAT